MTSLPMLEDVLKIASDPLQIARKHYIYAPESTGIFYVLSGVVRVFRTTGEGVVEHVDFYRAGHFFGLSCLHRPGRPETAAAHSDCVVYRWPVEQLAQMMEAHPALKTALMCESFLQAERVFERLVRTQQMQIAGLLRWTLLDLAKRIGVEGAMGTVISPGLTHQVLAEMIGTSREIVTCHLNQFRDAGVVDFDRKSLVIRTAMLRDVFAARKAAA